MSTTGAAAARLFSRSSSLRSTAAAARLSSSAAFRSIPRKPLSHRIFRCPVELSACLEKVQPFHTVTASALMTSMLTQSQSTYSWLSEDS